MNLSVSRFAFVSSLLVVAAASQADTLLTIAFGSSVTLNNSLFAYTATAPGLTDQNAAPLGTFASGAYVASASVKGTTDQYATYRYTLLSTYISKTDGHEGVVIGLNPTTATSALGNSFESVFGVPESSIVSAIDGIYSTNVITQYLSANTLSTFATNNLTKLPMGTGGGSLVAFSNGFNVGTVAAAPVPEPTTFAALGLGAMAMLRRRRRG